MFRATRLPPGYKPGLMPASGGRMGGMGRVGPVEAAEGGVDGLDRPRNSSPHKTPDRSPGPRCRDGKGKVERVMGIEPTLAAWEAAVLPLNYTRVSV